MLVYVLFYLGQLSHFPSCFGTGITNLSEPPSNFLLSPHYCGLEAGSVPIGAIVNKKAMRDEGVIYVAGHPLLNRRCTRLPWCFSFPKCKLQLLKARYSLTVLKVPLNSNQSINQSIWGLEKVLNSEYLICVETAIIHMDWLVEFYR